MGLVNICSYALCCHKIRSFVKIIRVWGTGFKKLNSMTMTMTKFIRTLGHRPIIHNIYTNVHISSAKHTNINTKEYKVAL